MQTQPDVPSESDSSAMPLWSLPTRIVFRLCFVYFSLLIFPFPLSYIPFTGYLWEKYEAALQSICIWIGLHVVHHPVIYQPTGSGDTAADWVRTLLFLVVAVVGTVVWSIIARKRTEHVQINNWFRLLLRLFLIFNMFGYGLDKVFPVQMPPPTPARLLEPLGDFSPMGLLWNFIGASVAYEIIVGLAEVFAGVFLIFPRTVALGAALAAIDMTQVFLYNMCYDVSVKLFSFQLLLMGLVLLAPSLRGFFNYFFLNRAAEPYVQKPYFRKVWANWLVVGLQIALGLYFFGIQFHENMGYFHQSHTKPPLYGIWSVDQFTADGQPLQPLITDPVRWQRVVISSERDFRVQSMDGKFERFDMTLDLAHKKAKIVNRDNPQWKADLDVEQPAPDTLEIKGEYASHLVDAKAKHVDQRAFLLNSRGFRWITELSFNR